jgi:hypothetical protein
MRILMTKLKQQKRKADHVKFLGMRHKAVIINE